MSYDDLIRRKAHEYPNAGFDPVFMPSRMFNFQSHQTDWAIRKGRAALFQDCGLGKTLQAIVWAQNVAQHTNKPALVWCHLNEEGDELERAIPGSVQVSGKMSDEEKEERMLGFSDGDTRVLITKPKIGAWGLNWQHCAHVTYFPSHSFEQYYQAIRRCWRFGQKNSVHVDIIHTEGQRRIIENMNRKGRQAESMFANLVAEMNNAVAIDFKNDHTNVMEVPKWL